MSTIDSLEDVLEKIGGFGRFQFFALVSIIYAELPAGMLGMLPVFVGGMPQNWTCVESVNGDFYLTRPIQSGDPCECNGTLEGGDTSIVSQWSLVCGYAWVSDFITSIQMAGMFAGGLFGSQISDWLGRKRTLFLSCLLMFIAAASSSLATSPFIYAGARFVVGFSMASYLVVGAIYPMEFFTPKWRSLSGTLGPWGEGVMLLAVVAYYFPAWRTLSWITALPMALVFLAFPFLPESPRWLLRKGREEEAKAVFAQIAKWNGCDKVDDKIIEKFAFEATIMDMDGTKNEKNQQQTGYLQLILNPKFRWKILTFMSLWFSFSLIYYGISFNTKNLSGNIYLNMVYMGLIDAVAFPSAVLVVNWLGRKKAVMILVSIASAPLVGIVLMELQLGIPWNATWFTFFCLMGKFFISGAWSSIKCFTGESFPTSVRSTAVGVCTVAAAFGGILAPQTIFLGTVYRPIPYFIYGGLAVGSTCLSLLLVETRGKPIEEDENNA